VLITRCQCRSASNYILGLTPLPLPAFMGGTVIGMGIWSVVYASIGGAGRSVQRSGVGLDTLLAGAPKRGKPQFYTCLSTFSSIFDVG